MKELPSSQGRSWREHPSRTPDTARLAEASPSTLRNATGVNSQVRDGKLGRCAPPDSTFSPRGFGK